MKDSTAHREQEPGYSVYRFNDGAGFAIGLDTHVWATWRMDGAHHAQSTVRRYETEQLARDDTALRLRFHRLVQKATPAASTIN